MDSITYFNALILRGGPNGITGAAITRMTEYRDDDGKTIAAKESDAIPVALAANDPGIPLAEVLGEVNAAALVTIEARDATIVTLTAEKQAAVDAKATADALAAQLQAQLAALAPVIDGVPQFIKKWQLWAGLRMDDPTLTLYGAVKAYTESFTGMKRDLWLDSTGIERTAPALEGFKAGFHKTDADIDDMFTRYAAITLAQASALG